MSILEQHAYSAGLGLGNKLLPTCLPMWFHFTCLDSIIDTELIVIGCCTFIIYHFTVKLQLHNTVILLLKVVTHRTCSTCNVGFIHVNINKGCKSPKNISFSV
jgi:hypothetical protein